jgi:crotonobetainyl-CoA:carnitine CoA-transferase CaiB-like acyl-CoA transferase
MPTAFPLAGVRVLELGIWVAAPATGSVLADWGASVTKLEPPAGGDPLRGIVLPGMEAGTNPWFDSLNRGKRSISVDLRNPAGRRVADQLLAQTDVFIINIQADAARRLGMDPETVRAAHPQLIYCRITGYGPRGVDANRPSFDGGAFWARRAAHPAGGHRGSDDRDGRSGRHCRRPVQARADRRGGAD